MTSAVSLTIPLQFAVECLRGLNQQGVGHFVAKFWEEGIGRCNPNFNTTLERHGAVIHRRNHVAIFSHLGTMHKCDRQTNCRKTMEW